MKKLIFVTCLCILALGAALPGFAQDGSPSVSADYLMALRPLGRIRIGGSYVTYNPDGYHIATIYTVTLPPIVHSLKPDATPDDIGPNTPAYGQRQDDYTPIYLYWLNMWDIRGGNLLWSQRLPVFNRLDGLDFSPQGDRLLVRLTSIEDSEKILLMVFDTLTGGEISRIDDLDAVDIPIIPGNIPQRLSAEAAFTPSGEYIAVDYRRMMESPHCALWRVTDAHLVWDQPAACGSFSQDGNYMVRLEPHTNSFSAYSQVTVYDVSSGTVIATSQDEVVAYSWLEATRLLLHRPYGDAPVIWDMANDTRAIIEEPYHLDTYFSPNLLQNILITTNGQYTYVWSKTTGGLLRSIEQPVGRLLELGGQIIELYTDPRWSEKEPEERLGGFIAYDFLSGAELWHNRWQNDPYFLFSPDRQLALTVDQTTQYLQIFNMTTGQLEGELSTLYGDFTFTPQWDWIYQTNGYVYTVWGPESELDRFDDQPNGVLREDTRLFRYPSFSSPVGKLRRGEYVWVTARTGGFNGWVWIEMADGTRYWIEAGKVKPFERLPNLPLMSD